MQFDRDLANVRWLEESSTEYATVLEATIRRLNGSEVVEEPDEAAIAARADGALGRALGEASVTREVRAAFLVPVDPWHGGLGTPRSLGECLAGKTVIQWTLERLGRSREAASIVLLVPDGFDIDSLIDRSAIGLPIEIHHSQGTPFGRSARRLRRRVCGATVRGVAESQEPRCMTRFWHLG